MWIALCRLQTIFHKKPANYKICNSQPLNNRVRLKLIQQFTATSSVFCSCLLNNNEYKHLCIILKGAIFTWIVYSCVGESSRALHRSSFEAVHAWMHVLSYLNDTAQPTRRHIRDAAKYPLQLGGIVNVLY